MFVVHDDFSFINIERTTLVTILNVKITFCLEASQRAPKTSKDMILAAITEKLSIVDVYRGPGYTSVATHYEAENLSALFLVTMYYLFQYEPHY